MRVLAFAKGTSCNRRTFGISLMYTYIVMLFNNMIYISLDSKLGNQKAKKNTIPLRRVF